MLRALMPPGTRLYVLDLLGSVGAENDGVFRADEDLVFDAHAEAMKVFGELRIGWDVHAWLDGDHHPLLQSNKNR